MSVQNGEEGIPKGNNNQEHPINSKHQDEGSSTN
jgi:hypothetical protein